MPEVGQDVLMIMNLHARCRANGALPHSGGVLDQPAYLMSLFDVIDATRAQVQDKNAERDDDDALRAKLAARLTDGR